MSNTEERGSGQYTSSGREIKKVGKKNIEGALA